MYIKGVNLGNWLVLEKWMSPGLFAGTTAEDEYYLPTQLPRDVYGSLITSMPHSPSLWPYRLASRSSTVSSNSTSSGVLSAHAASPGCV